MSKAALAKGPAAAAGSSQPGDAGIIILGDHDGLPDDDSILDGIGDEGGGDDDDEDDGAGDDDDDDPDTTPAPEDDDDEDAEASGDDDDNEGDEDELELPDEDEEEEGDDEEEEEEDAAELRLPEKFRKRLDKAKTQRDEARKQLTEEKTRAAQLEQKLAAFESEPVMLQPTANSPLSNVRNAAELQQTEQQWQALLDWAEDNEDGGTLTLAGGGTEELTKEGVRALRRQARSILEKHIPERRKYIEARAAHVAAVKKAYPWITNPEHPGSRFAAQFVQSAGLAARPDYELRAADAYLGGLIRTGKATAVYDPKTGQVKLMKRAKAQAAPAAATANKTGKSKPPVRAEAGAVPLQAAGKGAKGNTAGKVAAALNRGDGEAAALALFGA